MKQSANIEQDELATVVLEDFKSNTTLHGLPHALNSTRNWRKALWVCLTLGSAAALVTQLTENWETLFSYEIVKFSTPKLHENLTFPAVTICNENSLRKSKVINTSLQEVYEYLRNKTIGNVTDEVLYYPLGMTKMFGEDGHDMRDMLLTASWNGHLVTSQDFQPYFYSKYGKCFVFNGSQNKTTPARTTTLKGMGSGFEALLDIQPEEYMDLSPNEASSAIGLVVNIHDQHQDPAIIDTGVSVAPGSRVDFAIKLTQQKRLPFPYPSKCEKVEKARLPLTDRVYSVSRCEEECRAKEMEDKCRCRFLDLANDKDVPYCTPRNTSCIMAVSNTHKKCSCPTPCEENIYEVRTSAAYHPTDYFLKQAARLYYNVTNLTTEASIRDFEQFYRKRAVYIRVYFESLTSDLIEEKATYELPSFLSDIGGSVGLFLGCSFLTACEFLELFAVTVASLFMKFFRRNNNNVRDFRA